MSDLLSQDELLVIMMRLNKASPGRRVLRGRGILTISDRPGAAQRKLAEVTYHAEPKEQDQVRFDAEQLCSAYDDCRALLGHIEAMSKSEKKKPELAGAK